MKDKIGNRYNRVKLRNILHNFKSLFFERSPITTTTGDDSKISISTVYIYHEQDNNHSEQPNSS